MIYTEDSSLGKIYQHPLGRDVIDKILLQLGASNRWITNPIVRNLRVGALRYASFGQVDQAFLDTLLRLLNQDTTVPPRQEPPQPPWWKGAVFYQIYPRSFQDSNGDGIGDLPGITARLDYLQELGIDALWLSPIYDSPNDDNGYDIRDYRSIMSEFGTMEDFHQLLTEVHQRGMRLIMDMVVNHTSDEHTWFQQALADPQSPYRSYYFFSEAPNNWQSFFSGSAWRYFPGQDLWGLYLFSAKQMDLNWENPQVRREVADIARYWLDLGVDGFRLDVINYISKEPGLPDGSSLVGKLMGFTGIEHYFHGPRLHQHLAAVRQAVGDTFMVGETPGIGQQLGKLMTDPRRAELDLIFNFDHLETPGHVRADDYRYDLNYLKQYYIDNEKSYSGRFWMSLFLENHDNPRMISKVDPRPEYRSALGKLLGTIVLTLRGTPFLYQGQELGLVNHNFTDISQLRDVESTNLYQELLSSGLSADDAFARVLPGSRDHARAPIPWESSGGFTTGTPWIEGHQDTDLLNVTTQKNDPHSVWRFYRDLLHLRRELNFALEDLTFIDEDISDYWAYMRGNSLLVHMNLSDGALRVPPETLRVIAGGFDVALGSLTSGIEYLSPFEVRIWRRIGR